MEPIKLLAISFTLFGVLIGFYFGVAYQNRINKGTKKRNHLSIEWKNFTWDKTIKLFIALFLSIFLGLQCFAWTMVLIVNAFGV
jgi:hypothetical protein